jgi:hypothetical protein
MDEAISALLKKQRTSSQKEDSPITAEQKAYRILHSITSRL